MSDPLKDLRAKISPETDAVLEALNRATGKEKSELVRAVLHDWAVSRIHEASVMHRMLLSEGLPGILGGATGKTRESQGTSGNRGE